MSAAMAYAGLGGGSTFQSLIEEKRMGIAEAVLKGFASGASTVLQVTGLNRAVGMEGIMGVVGGVGAMAKFASKLAVGTTATVVGYPNKTSEEEMRAVAGLIVDGIAARGDEAAQERVRAGVAEIVDRFPVPGLPATRDRVGTPV